MGRDEKHRYGLSEGKHARMASGMASIGNMPRLKKHAIKAGEERDLMHPNTWQDWSRASLEAFEAAAAFLSPKEAGMLSTALDCNGWSAAMAISTGCFLGTLSKRVDPAVGSSKLRALAARGVDLGAARCKVGDVEVEQAMELAARGSCAGLAAMARVGMSPPGKLSPEQSAALSRGGSARCALHLLAASTESVPEPEEWKSMAAEAVAWLGAGHPLGSRDAQGRDALKIAIDFGQKDLALVLLDAGLDPRTKDAKGRSAVETLDRRCKAAMGQNKPALASVLMGIRAALISAAERLELAALAGSGSQGEGARKPRRGL